MSNHSNDTFRKLARGESESGQGEPLLDSEKLHQLKNALALVGVASLVAAGCWLILMGSQ